ncbi:maleylpyruvate isomerase N-terminal domain-containing protein [Streptomyces prunicolor]|uniref:maleylpyruvate isomerase N-terminal domain-containing protein n=1 Tax=Streptomyces prunicolor TaxID=67348 RepID=UPI00371E32A1
MPRSRQWSITGPTTVSLRTPTPLGSLWPKHAVEQLSGAALADDLNDTWQQVDRLCRAQPEGRVVRTRHGDPMLLAEFLLTRVVEVAVHGLDVADALSHEPWLTSQTADLVQDILLGPGTRIAIHERPSGHAGALVACLDQVASICQPITPVAPLAPSTSMRNDLGAAIRCSTTD